jgi:hypothetical protein
MHPLTKELKALIHKKVVLVKVTGATYIGVLSGFRHKKELLHLSKLVFVSAKTGRRRTTSEGRWFSFKAIASVCELVQ